MGGKGKFADKGKGKGKGKSGADKEDTSNDWTCLHCGFSNFAKNAVCGGEKSALGCKTPRAMADIYMLGMTLIASMSKNKNASSEGMSDTGAQLALTEGA